MIRGIDGARVCSKCGSEMTIRQRRGRSARESVALAATGLDKPVWRCRRYSCGHEEKVKE